MPWEIMPDNF